MSFKAAVLTISDKGSRNERVDTSGPAICDLLKAQGYDVIYTNIIPDEKEIIKSELIKCSDELHISLIVSTGGTGFSPRDITPEATLEVIERRTPGICEMMRAESAKITPKACLSRSEAGIRKQSLIINLPGSPKAAIENLQAVLSPIHHGLEMLLGSGSADCAEVSVKKKKSPFMDEWMKEAKQHSDASKIGMYLTHNGVVRSSAKAKVREGKEDTLEVKGMEFSYDAKQVDEIIQATYHMDGIYYIRVWLNEGILNVGDDIMYVLIGGDIRPHVIDALQYLVSRIKNECVKEIEIN